MNSPIRSLGYGSTDKVVFSGQVGGLYDSGEPYPAGKVVHEPARCVSLADQPVKLPVPI
jgi:hypothetical protein